MRKMLSLSTCLVLALGAVACGGEADEPSTSTAGDDEPTEQVNSMDVTMQDYAFGPVGQPAAGPLLLNFSNDGEEIHHAIVGRIEGDKTLEDIEKAVLKDGPPPSWFDDSPEDMQVLSPGTSAGIWIDAEAGKYVLLCFMPSPKGKPHAALGMYSTFDVAEEAEGTEPAAPDSEISISEDMTELPELQGDSVIEVTNDGKGPGEFVIAQLAEGKTLDDIDKWFGSGQEGPPPVTFFGGTHTFEPGDSVTMSLSLEPGDYTFVAGYGEGGKRKDIPVDFTIAG